MQVSFGRLFSGKSYDSRPRPRPRLLSESAIGLPPSKRDYFAPARFPVLDRLGLSLVQPFYRDHYYRLVDQDYTRIRDAAGFTAGGQADKRVLSAVRTTTAFFAWDIVSWPIVERGFDVATAAALLAIAVAVLVSQVHAPAIAQAALDLAVGVAVVLVARQIALQVPRKWPISAFIIVALCGVAGFGMVLVTRLPNGAWTPGLLVGLMGAITLWTIFVAALTVSAVFWIVVVARRVGRFPEEEIVRAIGALMAQLHRGKLSWRTHARRVDLMDRLEWIARCFERQYVARYTGYDRHTDAELESKARACAKCFRDLKKHVVFPSQDSYEMLMSALKTALVNTALNRWEALTGTETLDGQPSRHERFVANVRTAVGIITPIVVGAAFFRFGPAGDDARRYVAAMTFGWSLFSLIATLDPKGFETQTKAFGSFRKLFGGDATK
jgi:hypothetical protein